jgi:hypothetical protein
MDQYTSLHIACRHVFIQSSPRLGRPPSTASLVLSGESLGRPGEEKQSLSFLAVFKKVEKFGM